MEIEARKRLKAFETYRTVGEHGTENIVDISRWEQKSSLGTNIGKETGIIRVLTPRTYKMRDETRLCLVSNIVLVSIIKDYYVL